MSLSKFHAKSTALEVIEGHDLTGYEIIVTGGASGIGVETIRAFAKANARVVLGARDLAKAILVAEEIIKSTGNDKVEVEQLDLASLKSIRAFIERFLSKKRHLNILVNNAGIMACPLSYTEDGFESQFGTNHIGHFVLTNGLIPALKQGAQISGKNARVISISSIAHSISDVNLEDPNFKTREYEPWLSYGNSKTANVLFAVELNKRYAKDGIYSNAVMPGGIMTGLVFLFACIAFSFYLFFLFYQFYLKRITKVCYRRRAD
jgi:NAD(P)-dependent dehydrogenase (short-subunit alcohol dehydrogenase family)